MTTQPEVAQQRTSAPERKSFSNVTQRIVSSLVLLPAIIVMVFAGGWVLFLGTAALVSIGLLEFYRMVLPAQRRAQQALGVLMGYGLLFAFQLGSSVLWQGTLAAGLVALGIAALSQDEAIAWRVRVGEGLWVLAGVGYLAVPGGLALGIRQAPDGLVWLAAAVIATWSVDISAYAVGRWLGRRPFLTRISPNKTLEGALGGVIAGWLFPWFALLHLAPIPFALVVLVIVSPFVAIWGDTLESWLKRRANIKDSGLPCLNIMPGHGGLLDRVDALVWVLALFYGYLWLNAIVTLPV